MDVQRTFNYNLGVLGHIDSGKTSLVRALSTILSTAALDKSPQSQERGITLDLGFSAFRIEMPSHLSRDYTDLQITLVDCPGHASLIRTIIAGASIIDKMLLVIDATKGIQTQTAECIVIGELLLKSSLIVALNKVDLVDQDKLNNVEKRINAMLSMTKFNNKFGILKVAAAPREGDPIGIRELIEAISGSIDELPSRINNEPLYYEIDHCFPIKGQGTVMTGTILHGNMRVGDTLEIIPLGIQKKIKSMECFHQPVNEAKKGDRVGVCVTGFDSKLLERGVASTPNTLRVIQKSIIRVQIIPHYKFPIKSKAKFHITCGNETVMGSCVFFSSPNLKNSPNEEDLERFSPDMLYHYEDEVTKSNKKYWALLTLESPICTLADSLVIGAKLDIDVNSKACRIAFSGITEVLDPEISCDFIKVSKPKKKVGQVDRIQDPYTAIGVGMFNKETDISKFVGLQVKVNGKIGVIVSSFGKSGKFKINFPEGDAVTGEVVLEFNRLLWDPRNQMVQ
ncbi:unnamed protein product [Blepharisma stoltei]|uniref:Tr-type G domain-containing protein n=1 Tax=Blepharisma stoltei TaxID=1481888 RepID=A0AAU9ING0_9CILI|nr:unnamed protein product [Blepharisma stoltei]